jgi:putative endonuclease
LILRGWWARWAAWWSRRVGRSGELHAARYLRRRGLTILCRNVRCGRGEIDIVALEGGTLVFVEVKARTQRSWSEGLEKIDRAKRRALRSACRSYLRALPEPAQDCRIDGVSVEFEEGRFHRRLVEIRWSQGILEL